MATFAKRKDAARFIEAQMRRERKTSREKGDQVHYGIQELKDLLDFIYGGEPCDEDEKINSAMSKNY